MLQDLAQAERGTKIPMALVSPAQTSRCDFQRRHVVKQRFAIEDGLNDLKLAITGRNDNQANNILQLKGYLQLRIVDTCKGMRVPCVHLRSDT